MGINLKKIKLAGRMVWPLIEGGKGIALTTGKTSGAWAAEDCIGTFSAASPDMLDKDGKVLPYKFHGKTRQERQKEIVEQSIKGGIAQAKLAREISGDKGAVFMNVLWEMGACEEILEGILDGCDGSIDAVSSGAGMPFKLAEICAKRGVYYNPIVSSVRAFKLLWKRGFKEYGDYFGGVIYEDPWKAGGHNGLSNSEDPQIHQDPYDRIVEIRKYMNEIGLNNNPIIIAGGVWNLTDWEKYIDNPEVGPVAFQFGTRPLLTQESPLADEIKRKFFTLKKGDIRLQKYSPTGFWSSAVNNAFMQELELQSKIVLPFSKEIDEEKGFVVPVPSIGGLVGKLLHKAVDKVEGKLGENVEKIKGVVFLTEKDAEVYDKFIEEGFDHIVTLPDSQLMFVKQDTFKRIRQDQKDCVGCLSGCMFSGWSQREGLLIKPDARSFCIRKSLSAVAHESNPNDWLLFSGHSGYRFAQDEFYQGGNFIPTTKELIEQIKKGK
ncbi:MAG: nitronate monooxygenase [Alphaproteobacteria bacterium]|jgi:NAD(P)H-dependent flavin oxidoreductase YrpB (nitropropane dioxygenase family)|nr:nitronate monooxygenase [Alphaproteobacteria bacterium]